MGKLSEASLGEGGGKIAAFCSSECALCFFNTHFGLAVQPIERDAECGMQQKNRNSKLYEEGEGLHERR